MELKSSNEKMFKRNNSFKTFRNVSLNEETFRGIRSIKGNEKRVYLSYDLLNNMSFELLESLFKKIADMKYKSKDKNIKFDYLIAIGTGGYHVGKILYELMQSKKVKDALRKKYLINLQDYPAFIPVLLKSYEDVRKIDELRVVQWPKLDIKGKNVLLVDDVSDRGFTFLESVKKLDKEKPNLLLTCSLHIKSGTSFVPDVYVESIPKDWWIVYPYEKEAIEEKFINYIL